MKRSGETGRRGSGEAEINGKPEGSRHNGHRKKRASGGRERDQEGLKAIATRSRNSRAQDNVEQEQIKAGWHPAQWTRKKEPDNPAKITRKKKTACSEVEQAGVPIDRVMGLMD